METVLELKQITKTFGSFKANEDINFKLKKGEIHALLGENGAGKSTLMNIVFGLYQPDSGEIIINGQPQIMDNPNKAIDLGIGMVHQHFKLVEPFTVTENIVIGKEPKKGVKIDLKKAKAEVLALSEKYGLDIDPDAKIEEINVGMQQRVEIIKTLYRGANILIFDEPTAVLTPQEITEFLNILKKLVAEGKSIILITHKLKEIMEAADSCTIIRRGKVIETVSVATATTDSLAEMMVGKTVHFSTEKKAAKPKDVCLEVKEMVVKNPHGNNSIDDLSFHVRGGEILGIAGVDGNGQTELVEAITGMRRIDSGTILINGESIGDHSPREITEKGMAHIPEDRHKYGLVLDFSVNENSVLQTYYRPEMNRKGLINREAMNQLTQKFVTDFDIRIPSIETKARSLSGGNQQKLIIAREMNMQPKMMVAVQPTRGLDVGAIEFVHQQLVALRDSGVAVLLVSFELEEILNVSDRILVLFDGKIIGETTPETTNDRELGLMMAGKYQKGVS
ncbi:ABC transporter ATP-binding protein [Enterococcus rivorum]|uniref:Heme ABC transporter ATP-binding protein n=1 Tax=Enterococcus rivorum TaxID=762845 RepID=A0A1E5KSL6_9ENTE|nr:ABC transporter ATP-binding protein [Enterococcus rivorum]MBP2098193.1 simple sugar transport system ATP-binding protein [Enterococcus rivorum]OEH80885.1 heme ABC transporter ATP-binding protein [Enterococcus rivorum]